MAGASPNLVDEAAAGATETNGRAPASAAGNPYLAYVDAGLRQTMRRLQRAVPISSAPTEEASPVATFQRVDEAVRRAEVELVSVRHLPSVQAPSQRREEDGRRMMAEGLK